MKPCFAIAFAGALFLSAGAKAGTIVTATLTGPLTAYGSHFDVFGITSPADQPSNEPATLVLSFDLDKVNHAYNLGGESLQGPGTAVLTLNGHSFTFMGEKSYLNVYPDNLAVRVSSYDDSTSFGFSIYEPGSIVTPASLSAPFSLSACPVPSTPIFFCNGSIAASKPGAVFSGDFAVFASTIQVSVSQTPIPPSLPLLAATLAGLGWVGWQRNRAAAV